MTTCLHFRIDRMTGVCQTCGGQVRAAVPVDDARPCLGFLPQADAAAAAEEDLHLLVARMKAEAAGVLVQDPIHVPIPDASDDLLSMLIASQEGIESTPVPTIAPAMLPIEIIHPDDQDDDYDRTAGPIDEPQFRMIAGTAGTGKTWLAKERAEKYTDAVLCATTGIAAVNVGGVTINSMLGYANTDDMRVAYEVGKLGAFLRILLRSKFYRLIIDEVSMMDGHQLDILCAAVDDINTWQRDNGLREMGITLVGDFAQLAPINAPFVFQRPSWGRFNTNILTLTEPRRQADPAFVRALQAVRRGDRKVAMEYFGPLIVSGEKQDYQGSTILAKNDEVDRYNKLRLMSLSTQPDTYNRILFVKEGGKIPNEWIKNIPETLELKPGALVMILANKREPGDPSQARMIYANGDLGIYKEKLNDRMARVELIRNALDVVVEKVLREKGKPTGRSGKKLARSEVEASIEYMPLRVAYATTCHKSQGLSLDNVQIMFHSRFWATPGMLYVGLSRARTPRGLRLVGTPQQFEARITVNPDIRGWL